MSALRIAVVCSLPFLLPGKVFSGDYRDRIVRSSHSPKQLERLRRWSYDKEKLLEMSEASIDSTLLASTRRQLRDGGADGSLERSFLDPIVLRKISCFDKCIDYYSRRYSIEPNLVKAIIYAESSGNPRGVSPKGAKGLMQLMPDTAAELGVGSVFEPAENIAGGTRFLRQQLERFGHVQLALWAYNAGPQMVVKRILPSATYRYILKVLLIKSMIDRGL